MVTLVAILFFISVTRRFPSHHGYTTRRIGTIRPHFLLCGYRWHREKEKERQDTVTECSRSAVGVVQYDRWPRDWTQERRNARAWPLAVFSNLFNHLLALAVIGAQISIQELHWQERESETMFHLVMELGSAWKPWQP